MNITVGYPMYSHSNGCTPAELHQIPCEDRDVILPMVLLRALWPHGYIIKHFNDSEATSKALMQGEIKGIIGFFGLTTNVSFLEKLTYSTMLSSRHWAIYYSERYYDNMPSRFSIWELAKQNLMPFEWNTWLVVFFMFSVLACFLAVFIKKGSNSGLTSAMAMTFFLTALAAVENVYESNLSAILSAPIERPRFRNLYDVAKEIRLGKAKLWTWSSAHLHYDLDTVDEHRIGEFRALHAALKIFPPTFIKAPMRVICQQIIDNPQLVYIDSDTYVDPECDLTCLRKETWSTQYFPVGLDVMGFHRRMKEAKTAQMLSHLIPNYWTNYLRWHGPLPAYCNTRQNSAPMLNQNIFGAAFILALSSGCAVVALLIEIVHFRLRVLAPRLERYQKRRSLVYAEEKME